MLPTGPLQPLCPSLTSPSPAGPFTTLTEPTSSQIALGFGFFFGGLAQFCAGEFFFHGSHSHDWVTQKVDSMQTSLGSAPVRSP